MRATLLALVLLAIPLGGCHVPRSPVAPSAPSSGDCPDDLAVAPAPLEVPAEPSALSPARAAYERLVARDCEGARPAYAKARLALDADGLVDEQPSLRGALGLLRLEAERQQRAKPEEQPDVDCRVFAKHGYDALVAYRAWFASTRDTYAFDVKHQCLDVTLAGVPAIDQAPPSGTSREASTARSAACCGLMLSGSGGVRDVERRELLDHDTATDWGSGRCVPGQQGNRQPAVLQVARPPARWRGSSAARSARATRSAPRRRPPVTWPSEVERERRLPALRPPRAKSAGRPGRPRPCRASSSGPRPRPLGPRARGRRTRRRSGP